jgi:hypothetical protein
MPEGVIGIWKALADPIEKGGAIPTRRVTRAVLKKSRIV